MEPPPVNSQAVVDPGLTLSGLHQDYYFVLLSLLLAWFPYFLGCRWSCSGRGSFVDKYHGAWGCGVWIQAHFKGKMMCGINAHELILFRSVLGSLT